MSSLTQDLEFGHLRIPLEDIASATDSFADENLIGSGGFGKVYKGQLLRSGQLINIAARKLDRTFGQGDAQFWTEISLLSRLNHKNIVSMVGYCDEHGEKIVINKYEVNGSLDKYLSDPTLTWMQRLHISVDAARVLRYIHYDTGRSYGVIHRNIKSSKILLDENREAKVCGFGLSISYAANRRHRLVFTELCGTPAYVDPIYMETRSVTHKSDVYSFGLVLFEVLCGRKAMVKEDDGRYKSLASMATEHYEEGKLDEIIDPDLRKQMDPQTSLIFSDTAYRCLSRERRQRPDMENVVKSLEKALEFQWRHENPEPSRTPFEGTSSNYLKGRNLDHLKIQLSDVVLATENFTKNCIGSGTYGAVYKAELNHFDGKSLSATEGMNKDEIPKRRGSVAIKRIFNRQDDQGEQGFFAEIDMLTSCKHRNIVSLLGFCHEDLERILVYEFASNGSLANYLENTDNVTPLTWMQRINMCLDIAHGLNYLHTTMENKERIIHRDIKSDNILLFEKWEAKIADFGLSRFHPKSTIVTTNLAGTEVYSDPEYMKTGKLKKESDTYSFGVVLFEIMCGRLAYDEIYYVDDDKGLPSIVRRRFNEGTLKEMIDTKIKEETDANVFTLHRGPNQDSLDTFFRIGYQCLAETQAKRPTMDFVIKELEKALHFQENDKDSLKSSLEDVKLATENFSDKLIIGRGGFGNVYKGEVPHANGENIIAIKRLDRSRSSGQGEAQFLSELEILFEYQHEKVIGLVGYCDEKDEKIIVYEYASRGSLDRYLKDDCLTWMKRLEICIDVATGLDFFHGTTDVKQEVVLHRDIKSSNILLNVDWKAKISDFGLSLVCPMNPEMDYVIDNAAGTLGYCDPLYVESGFLTKESDIYSLGVVLFEILCGRWAYENYEDRDQHLVTLARNSMNEGRLEEMVFEGIKEQIVPESLTTYSTIAYRCLHNERKKRPTASEVLVQLKKALEFQEDYEIWKPKLPADYKELTQMSESPEIYSRENNKDLYTMFSKGILLQKGKLWFSLGSNGERNEMVSARKFSYKNRRSRKWQSIPKSRFPKVAEMVDILNLKIQIKIKTQFLSPGVNYRVHLIFRFCGPRKSLAKRMYVNLKYKKGKENLHAYFATWREDEWMMIELCRFYNHEEHTDFEVLLESFSRCYCGSRAIYVEGIEFRAIDNVIKHEEIEKLKQEQVMKSNSSTDCEEMYKRSENYDEGGKLRYLKSKMKRMKDRMKRMKDRMQFAKNVVDDTFNVTHSNSKSSVQVRLEGVTELLRQQVFRIKCKVKSQMLSPNTENVCYLVFKLSEKCCGLHCPVIVRDLRHWRNKETGILYFRTPDPWNLHDTDWVPKQRKDGWTEVIVWKFNSTNGLKNDDLPLNLKLISYEGTMSGLIVCGLEFRTM